jgi:DNA-binding NarL/FixJ family response regulator
MEPKIRILLADDHTIMREGLRVLLERHKGLTVVAEASNGRDTVRLAAELNPDVVVMDVAMPVLNGIEAARQIVANTPGVRILALSVHSDKRFVTNTLQAGAKGYLLKDCASEELVLAIRCVMRGETYLSPSVAGHVVDGLIDVVGGPKEALRNILSAREREVLQNLAEGRSTKEVAEDLGVSRKTVETHRMRLMNKLDVHSIAELTKYAIREGITSLES